MDLQQEARIAVLQQKFDEFKQFEQANNAAVDAKWRGILTEETNSEQRAAIAKVRAGYTKQLDRCDAVIHRLLQWLSDGEGQYQFALRAQKHNLGSLSNLANRRIGTAFDRFTNSIETLRTEFNNNRGTALSQYRRHVAEVRDITAAIEHEYDVKGTGMDERYRADRESLQQKAQELISTLRTHLTDETNKSLEAQKNADDSFKNKSEGKTQQYKQMAAKDMERKRKMKLQEEKIIRLAAQISHWRRKIRNNERESQEANDRLKQEKENLSLHFRELKATMAQFRVLENRKLAEISVAYDNAIKGLEEKLKLAEKILKYAEVTRKLETEREQVLPFTQPMSETDPEMANQVQQFKLQLKGDPKYVAESDLFDRFYRRFNSVLLQKLTLQREKEGLLQHNVRLKNMMKRYMGGMGVSQSIMTKPNTLFIVNQSTNAPMRRVQQDGIPIVDANLTVAANQLQGY
jgi:hypothetical protein